MTVIMVGNGNVSTSLLDLRFHRVLECFSELSKHCVNTLISIVSESEEPDHDDKPLGGTGEFQILNLKYYL